MLEVFTGTVFLTRWRTVLVWRGCSGCPYARVGWTLRRESLIQRREGCPYARLGWTAAAPRGDPLAPVAPMPAWAGRADRVGGSSRGTLPLCPRGLDGRPPAADYPPSVAPMPAWAGRARSCRRPASERCPYARVGWTHGKHWGLTLWKARKCPKVVGGLPMGAGDPRRGLPADTASGQGQAFQVSGPNPGDSSREGACKAELYGKL